MSMLRTLATSLSALALLGACAMEVGDDSESSETALEGSESALLIPVRTSLTRWTTNAAPDAVLLHGNAVYYSFSGNIYAIGTEPIPRSPFPPVLLCTGCGAKALATDGTLLYFSATQNGGRIARMPLAGGAVTDLVTNAGVLNNAFGLTDTHLYYLTSSNVMRVSKQGGAAEVYKMNVSPSALAVAGNTLCWNGAGGLHCKDIATGTEANIAGPAVRTVIHVGGSYVYWGVSDGSIMRSPVTSASHSVVKNPEAGRTIREIVTDDTRAFFVDRPTSGDATQRRIRRVPLTGGNGGTLYGQDVSTQGAMGIRVRGLEIYWGDNQGIEGAPNYPQEFAL